MDPYSGYNQIRMHQPDQEHAAFLTDQGLYCYKVMPFGLKNAGATYQRLVNKMFKQQIGKTMEVYVGDMLVKRLKADEHINNLRESFEVLREYKMKLNPAKCAFGVTSGNFLCFMVNHRVILVSPEGVRLSCALHFRLKATNNQAEYEALLAGLRLAKEVSARHLLIYSDSQLIMNQVNSEYQAKGEKMAFYLEKAKELLGQFDTVTITQIPRNENTNADALARLATGLEDSLLKMVPLEILDEPSINKHQQVDAISDKPT
ncbi:hypothetical protein UlMin_033221 [Ulmus minor]